MNMVIRKANADDRHFIRELVRQSGINPFGLRWQRFLIAFDDGQRIGCVQLKPHRDGSRELASLVVAPAWRHRGVARELIGELQTTCAPPLWLTCRSGLRRFYRQYGFREVEQDEPQPGYYRWARRAMRLYARLRRSRLRLAVMVWEG